MKQKQKKQKTTISPEIFSSGLKIYAFLFVFAKFLLILQRQQNGSNLLRWGKRLICPSRFGHFLCP